MRDLHELDTWRVRSAEILAHYGHYGDGTCGMFALPHGGQTLYCLAASGGGWDHVSVSLSRRCPSWDEMEFVKRRFFKDDEVAMQLHLPPRLHKSFHPFCLHIWRPQAEPIALPPVEFV